MHSDPYRAPSSAQISARFLARTTLVTLLLLGCLFVVYPFVAAMLFAAVLCTSTWPIFEQLRKSLGNRPTLAAFVMTLGLTLVFLLPLTLIASHTASGLSVLSEYITPWVEQGGLNEPPIWLSSMPWIGDYVLQYWHTLSESRTELLKALQVSAESLRPFLLKTASLIANGVIQLALVLLVAFFFYRDGAAITRLIRTAVEKIGGQVGHELLYLAKNTVNGVMIGIVGTALAQALVMLLGLLLSGVPGAVLLTAATFFLSLVPVGPPLVWGGAALWLYSEGSTGWAIFMVAYGLIAVSSVDNFLKPMLISRSASLPILLIALGVFGGILAFGFIGIFLGPTLLALAYVLFLQWTRQHEPFPFHNES